jgi:hypothetical protein
MNVSDFKQIKLKQEIIRCCRRSVNCIIYVILVVNKVWQTDLQAIEFIHWILHGVNNKIVIQYLTGSTMV